MLPLSDHEIVVARGHKSPVDPQRPYAFLNESEYQPSGAVEEVAVIFLTNRECPFKCLMCDLWQHTTEAPVPAGAIPAQIDFALARLTKAKHIKLYNSGNFFDPLAIPVADYPAIAARVAPFDSLVVENHPAVGGSRIDRFVQCLHETGSPPRFEIAMGLETIHPDVIKILNKRLSLHCFQEQCGKLRNRGIDLRAFILLRPPLLDDEQGVLWAVRSAQFAFECGVQTISIIPTRAGNGVMDRLAAAGMFQPPTLSAMETVLEQLLSLKQGRVFIDLWDAEANYGHEVNSGTRIERLRLMNMTQEVVMPLEDRSKITNRYTGEDRR